VRILAIETATPASSVALGEDESLVAMSVRVDRRGHIGFLVPAIDFCFAQAGWSPGDLDLVAVDVGPGPYTGIRAGLATAQAIAAAVGAQVVTISSVTVIALRAATGRRTIWPVVDVRRGQVATAPFSPVPGGVVRNGDTEIVTPDQFVALIESSADDALVVGDWQAIPEGLLRSARRAKVGRPRYPAADTMLEIAMMKAKHEEFASADEIRPLYMREADAVINWSDFRDEGIWPGEAS
jgi:tRNA threonylcarbamoyladenosine biosynthesis protein TsaB